MKLFTSALILILSFFPFIACQSQIGRTDTRFKATHIINILRLDGTGGFCTSSAIGPHALISAAHCDLANTFLVDGSVLVHVLGRIFDDNEHVIFLVDGPEFKKTIAAFYDPSNYDMDIPGKRVFFYGNAYGTTTPLLREGYNMGFTSVLSKKIIPNASGTVLSKMPTGVLFLFDIHAVPGDSGGALYDSDTGKLVSIISTAVFDLGTGGYALRFTSKQVRQAKTFKGVL